MLIAGKRVFKEEEIEERFPYDNSLVGTIPRGNERDVDLAVESAKVGFEKMKGLTAYERFRILERAARLLGAVSLQSSLLKKWGKP